MKDFDFATKCVHTGNDIDKETGAIRRPLIMANSCRLPEDASALNWSDPNQLLYTRTTSANQIDLQEKLAALEGERTASCWEASLVPLTLG